MNSDVICLRFFFFYQKDTSNPNLKSEGDASQFSVLFWWAIGITILTAALFISARMGIYQEVLYKKFGKHPNEALFYTVNKIYSIRKTLKHNNI